MARYKPGDRVRVREDLCCSRKYHMDPPVDCGWVIIEPMIASCGKIYTIEGISENGGCYTLEEVNCFWTDEMFEEGWQRDLDLDIDEADMEEYLI